MYEFNITGSNIHHKRVTKISTGAHVYVPKPWLDKKVAVVLLEELDD